MSPKSSHQIDEPSTGKVEGQLRLLYLSTWVTRFGKPCAVPEKNLAEAENHKLARQALQAQQEVNTANAQADALEATSTAEANAIRKKGEAEADAIKAKAKALRDNPLIVELTKAQQWNSALSTIVTSDSGGMILQLKQ